MPLLDEHTSLLRRHLCFLGFALISALCFFDSLRTLVQLALAHDYDSQILLIVPISAYLIYRKRHEVFSNPRWGRVAGTSLFVAGAMFALASVLIAPFSPDLNVTARVLGLIVIWIAGFIFFYGAAAFRAARFPLLFLLLLLPIPNVLVDRAIFLLQQGSAFVAFWVFKTLNVPVMREAMVFHIPTLDLEVSKECSGIRSSLVLLITTLLIAEFALRSGWRKLVLVLCVIPIVVLKNGLRIVTISLLTVYVNRGFLHGWLHHSGGIVFYLLGLWLLLVIVKLLQSEPTARSATDRAIGLSAGQRPESQGMRFEAPSGP